MQGDQNLVKVVQVVALADWFLVLDNTGNNKAAKMAMMAMTTSNSISVNPRLIIALLENMVMSPVNHNRPNRKYQTGQHQNRQCAISQTKCKLSVKSSQ